MDERNFRWPAEYFCKQTLIDFASIVSAILRDDDLAGRPEEKRPAEDVHMIGHDRFRMLVIFIS